MAFGLYKPGQGYWVRVLTATMAGVLLLAAAAWLWGQLEAASTRIPRPTWTLTLDASASGEAAPGQPVVLLGERDASGQRPQLATAVVESVSSEGVTIGQIQIAGNANDISGVRAIEPAPGSASTLRGGVAIARGNPIFDPMYLQAAGVSLLVIIGTAVIYWFVGVNPSSAEFLIATDGEMKKVNWSTRRDIINSTGVVILWSVLLAAGLWVVDFLFSQFFTLIGVLQS